MSVLDQKVGRPPYLITYEDAFLVAAAEIEGDHGFPIDTDTIPAELQCVVESVKSRPTCKETTLKSTENYFGAVVKRVNVPEETHDKQRNNSRPGLIKISSLSHNRSNQSDLRLAWIRFHKIDHI